jgi:hypothetical protein
MLARNPISDAIMIDVDYLNFGKLISSADGLSAAPEGLGVTSRSSGLKAEHDGELRLNTLLEVQVFSPAMIDPKMADKGLLLVRTLPATAAAPRGRTVFVRARFRQESSTSSDSRPHQQASIWVVSADKWNQHPAAILAKVGMELEAEPDSADGRRQRFGVPPKEVALDVPHGSDENTSNEKWKYAHYRILDMLLRELNDKRPPDRDVTFGSDVFDTEAEFLTVVGRTLRELPLDFERWKDIRIGSGLRSSGGLTIRYLPSEEKTIGDEIPPERIVSIRYRQEKAWGGQPPRRSLSAMPSGKPSTATLPPSGLAARAAPPASQFTARTAPAASEAAPGAATNQKGLGAVAPGAAARDFRFSLIAYRENKNEKAAGDLIAAATNAKGANVRPRIEQLEQGLGLTYDAVCSVMVEPPGLLPLGALYDRALLLSRMPASPVADQWFEALSAALAKAGVLLPKELSRLQALNEKLPRNETLRDAYRNSQELALWLKQVRTNPGATIAIPDLSFVRKLLGRLDAISLGLSLQSDGGINNEVMIRANFVLSQSELFEAHRDLLKCAVTNLCNTHDYYQAVESGPPQLSQSI